MPTEPIAPEVELLPCPFCGGAADFHDIGDEEPTSSGGVVVVCGTCQACSAVMFPEKCDVRPLLAEKWNSRAPSLGLAQRSEDSEMLDFLLANEHGCAEIDAGGTDEIVWRCVTTRDDLRVAIHAAKGE